MNQETQIGSSLLKGEGRSGSKEPDKLSVKSFDEDEDYDDKLVTSIKLKLQAFEQSFHQQNPEYFSDAKNIQKSSKKQTTMKQATFEYFQSDRNKT